MLKCEGLGRASLVSFEHSIFTVYLHSKWKTMCEFFLVLFFVMWQHCVHSRIEEMSKYDARNPYSPYRRRKIQIWKDDSREQIVCVCVCLCVCVCVCEWELLPTTEKD